MTYLFKVDFYPSIRDMNQEAYLVNALSQLHTSGRRQTYFRGEAL